MANEFVLTPAAWLQPASLFTPTPKAAQRVLEFSARRSITITRARLISTPRAAFRTDHRSVLERGGHQFGGKARKERVSWSAWALGPILFAVSSGALRSVAITRAPRSANAKAIACPIPWPAPGHQGYSSFVRFR